jgi:Flp pilus assembly protein TadD
LAIGRVYLDLGQTRESIRTLRELTERFPQQAEAFYLLGLAYSRTSQPEPGRRYLQQARELFQKQNNGAGVEKTRELLQKVY